jgi:hypothetical protein
VSDWKNLLEWAEASGIEVEEAYQVLLNLRFDKAKAKLPIPVPVAKDQLPLPLGAP